MQRLRKKWAQWQAVRRKSGILAALRHTLNWLVGRFLPQYFKTKRQPLDHYAYVLPQPFGPKNQPGPAKTLNWVIPDFQIGSGGHLNIFRLIYRLEQHGFVCRICIDGPSHFTHAEAARDCIQKHFFPVQAAVGLGRQSLQPAAATFATAWQTAYTVRDFQASGKKYYFVQDFEPLFYPSSSEYTFAEATYHFGFKGITAGNWLAGKLADEYAMQTVPLGFSYDHDLYRPRPRRDDGNTQRVFFYARPVTPRRGFELGIMALAQLHAKRPDVGIVLAGWDIAGYQVPFPYLNAGVVALDELADLYSQCDIALVLSLTNLSLLPLEVMACRCAVVSNRGANVTWGLAEDAVQYSEMTPQALADAMLELLCDADRLEALKEAGLQFAQTTDWANESDKLVHTLEHDLA